MSKRFFVDSPISPPWARLIEAEAHHLIHVMRAHVGDEVVLFDGGGAEFTAKVSEIDRTEVRLEVIDRREIDRELSICVTLGVAFPKGDRQRILVEKCAELGVGRVVPLLAHRGVAQPVESALKRLRRTVIETSKQCGRNRLMEVSRPCTLVEFLASAPLEASRLLAHPGGVPISGELGNPKEIYAAVGPEGGFTDEEVAMATDAGWKAISLGRSILRVETAAVALAALLASEDW